MLPASSAHSVACLLASGSNSVGQLGTGDVIDSHTFAPCTFDESPQSTTPPSFSVHDIAAGGRHTLILLRYHADNDSELWGCGDASRGQLGPQHHTESTPVFRPIELPFEIVQGCDYRLIACSWETSYVVLSCAGRNDILLSMGADDFGNLGRTMRTGEQTPAVHHVNFDHVLPEGTARFVVASLSAGLYHVVVHLEVTLADGSIRFLTVGWGLSRHGQLGQASVLPGVLEGPRPVALDRADDDDPIHSISLGNHHSVFLHGSVRASGLGSSKKHQLRGIDDQKDVRALGCTWNGTYLVAGHGDDVQILSAGSHSKGQLGRRASDDLSFAPVHFTFDSGTRRFVSMACGSEHVLVLFDVVASSSSQGAHDMEREVWGWGWNEHGNLGLGTTDDVALPRRIWPDTFSASSIRGKVVGIWAGCGTSWIAIERTS